MKHIFLLLLACISLNVTAQKFSEGKITMEQTMTSDNEQMNAHLSNMKMSVVTFFKGNKSRTETSSAMTGENISIIDGDLQKGLVLMNNPMMGKTYADLNLEVTDKDLENVKVEKLQDTKTVLGYKCQGYKVNTNQNGVEVSITLYATDEIKVARDKKQLGAEIEGYPLHMEITMMQMGAKVKMISSATNVEAQNVSDDLFKMEVPEGYTKVEVPKN
jgi:outer membrane lipoprotein-sorting protein